MPQPPPALLADLYELTMLRGYHARGMHRREACFDLFFRRPPFGGGYAVCAGLADALAYLAELHFTADELAYLATTGLFDERFLAHLRDLRFTGEVYAIAEGEPVFPGEPLLRVHAALEEAQLVETALVNLVGFQTLVATKAARICQVAGTDRVIEFGLRRAPGPDGGLSASRAAFVGGCAATSNVEAGRRWGLPVRGTHAHSWVLAFPTELAAFRAYAATYPDDCILLVDTYDTLASGVPNAIRVAQEMRAGGHRLNAIRLDSGDSAALAREARWMLDAAELPDVRIVCSGDLDEYAIRELKRQGAPIDTFGVGTRLVTAHDDPSLTAVYKMAALRDEQGAWSATMKLSDEREKATLPGIKQVWRSFDEAGTMCGDRIELEDPVSALQPPNSRPLLTRVMAGGRPLAAAPPLAEIRARTLRNLALLPEAVRRLENPAPYPVTLGPALVQEQARLRARAANRSG